MFVLLFPLLEMCILHFPSLVKPQLTEVKETAPPSTLDLSHHQHEEEMEELRNEVENKSWMLLEVKVT